MRDMRALRNTRNLRSYSTWERESLQRSGFAIMAAIGPLVLRETLFGELREISTRSLARIRRLMY